MPTSCSAIGATSAVFLTEPPIVMLRRGPAPPQPYLPQDSSPLSTPDTSPSSSPFPTSTPKNTPFFPSYVSPPLPSLSPAPVSFASFPASAPYLGANSKSAQLKLIGGAVAAVIAALSAVSLSVFVHIRLKESRVG